MIAHRPIRIVLISPKGPLYRHRGGIFGRSLRYMPLTLPTLVSLVPEEIPCEITCVDEGIEDVDLDIEADLVGLTLITGTATRGYELAAHFRGRGIPVVLGGPHVTLVPDDAQPHADAIVVGYAEQEWPRLLHDFVAGRMAVYSQMQRRSVGNERPTVPQRLQPGLVIEGTARVAVDPIGRAYVPVGSCRGRQAHASI